MALPASLLDTLGPASLTAAERRSLTTLVESIASQLDELARLVGRIRSRSRRSDPAAAKVRRARA